MTPDFIAAMVSARWFALLAVALLTLPYWSSAIFKTIHWQSGVAEMRAARLSPAPLFAVLTIAVQALGCLLLISGFAPWLGAGMLGGFTVAATVIAHPYWKQHKSALRIQQRTVVFEHAALIGGLMLAVAVMEYF